MLRKCVRCQYCESRTEHYENVPELFGTFIGFHCLKYNKYLGNMKKKKNDPKFLDCFVERQGMKDSF